MKTEEYFKKFKEEVDKVYSMAEEAKKTGYDPVDKVEIPLAMNMAEKVVGLISNMYPQMKNSGIAERISELEKDYGKLDATVVFKIGEEVARQKFCEFDSLIQAIDAGTRIGLAYITLGVVSSPMEGFTGLKTRKRKDDGKEFIEASFAGPIRSAGTTASCIVLMLIDYLREIFGYAKYDPTEEEIKRVYTELQHFHDRVTNLQYMPTEEEANFLAKNMPILVAGDPSESVEVPNYKNLDRIDTNYLRSGYCLVMAEGLAQKAPKGFRKYKQAKKNGVKASGFDFLEEYLEIHEKTQKGGSDSGDTRPTYIKDLVAGRPVYGHPSKPGGFRFRYGRSRVSGFSSASMHPASMAVTENFIATGTQLKIEKPSKGCAVTACDYIDGPTVKFKDGSVKRLYDKNKAREVYPDIKEIIYLGDLLFPFSDLANRNADFIKPGYVEEWWNLELKEKTNEEDVDAFNVNIDRAVELSKKYDIPLHPSHIFYWNQISKEQFEDLIEWLKNSWIEEKIIFPYDPASKEKFEKGKRALELLGIEHQVTTENVVIDKETSKSFLVNIGLDMNLVEESVYLRDYLDKKDFNGEDVLEVINNVSEFEIKDKAGEFIGARMGRPEKAKLRKLQGSPQVLFPVGNEGGKMRTVQAACKKGYVRSDFPLFYCKKCNQQTIYPVCESCDNKTIQMYYFPDIKEKSFNKEEKHSEKEGVPYCNRKVDIKYYYEKAMQKIGMKKVEAPEVLKGVKGTSSENHVMENLVKGLLRAKHGLRVNKDGTVRIDGTELPLIYFKPKEVSASVEKLRELGYTEDIYGKPLENDNQVLETMPHDVLLPAPEDTFDERGDDIFVKTANFVDEELEKYYGLKKHYNVKKREDLIGKMGVCMAPHNCAGVACRIIGFANAQGLFASPYIHAAIRRDCFDYDTYIPIKRNGYWRIEKIGSLVEEQNPQKVVDKFGTKEKKVKGYETLSYKKGMKESKINNFTKHSENKMIELKTALGKRLKVTENHKFFIENKEKRASELKIGDRVPLQKRISINSKDVKSINIVEFLKNEKGLMIRNIKEIIDKINENSLEKILKKIKISKKQFTNFKLRDSFPLEFVLELDNKLKDEIYEKGKISFKRDKVSVPIKIEINEDLLELIGLYIAEGYSRTINSKKGLNQVYISSEDSSLRNFIEKTIKKYFGLVKTEKKKDRVTFSSKILYLFFIKILETGTRAKNKRIPYMFLSLPLKKLSALLRGYFEGDGSVSYSDMRVNCDTISEGLLQDLEFCLSRYGIFTKRYEYTKKPGSKLKDFYLRKKKEIPEFSITKLIIGSDFINEFKNIGFMSKVKNKVFKSYSKKKPYGMRINQDKDFVYDSIVSIKEIGMKKSYCLNVNTGNHLVSGNSVISKQCDGDEAAVMLLGDVLLNFSKEFLPGHRGGTQDAPLVLNAKIDAGEVDDQILDMEMIWNHPLEMYRLAEKRKHSSEIEIPSVESVMKEGGDPFRNMGFTHDTSDFNDSVVCCAYKKLGQMQEKVGHQMELAEKLRSADSVDTAKLIIDRHFMRDMRGNLRKFSQQDFRCVDCNEILRRPPLIGKCPKCGGKLIFTIHEGGIKKYLEPALDLSRKYNLSTYMKQNLELVKRYIDSIFGKESEKQENINQWF